MPGARGAPGVAHCGESLLGTSTPRAHPELTESHTKPSKATDVPRRPSAPVVALGDGGGGSTGEGGLPFQKNISRS